MKRKQCTVYGVLGTIVLTLCSCCAQLKVDQQAERIWGEKPVLGYLFSDKTLPKEMGEDIGLTELQLQKIGDIARAEQDSLRLLYAESEQLTKEETLTPEERRAKIKSLNYNNRVNKILHKSKTSIENVLTAEQYDQFVEWVERKWATEVKKHGAKGQK